MLFAETARTSSDPRLRTMAKILELLMALVPARLAAFYAVDGRLRYPDEPVVALVSPRHDVDVFELLRRHHERFGGTGPFAPSRVAPGVKLRSVRDLTPADRRALRWDPALPATLRANIYLRERGRVVAGICLMRHPDLPDPSVGDLSTMRRAQPLFEEAYTLARASSAAAPSPVRAASARLTARERQIAALIARAASNGEIAETLQISRHTVKIHVRNLLAKLDVANRQQAMILLGGHSVLGPLPSQAGALDQA